MNPYEFEQFLKYSQIRSSTKSDSEKISSFIQWCKDKEIEEVILRLSTEEKNWMHENYFLDFTTSRVIVSKKSFTRKILDTGFIAGMAPFPYMILAKGKKIPDFKKGINLNSSETIRKDISNFFIWYSEIEELHMRKGIETTVSNMLGTAISANFLTIKAINGKEYTFRLPVRKNGPFEKIYFWLNKVIPVKISAT
ncbi:MAG TPA: hypothetical protein VE378_03110 [Nitrososphaeraceae archaeon]|nr:hypothetical protein [Nitrososphaeraceae archaeon]